MVRGLTLLTSLLCAGAALATTMVPLDLKQLTERADRVVLARVESATSRWTEAHDAIFTEVTLRVERSYKGPLKAGDTFVVRREGGAVDGIGQRVFGAPHFAAGEEVVVFVEPRGGADWVVGMAQGKLRVTRLPDGSRQVAAPDISGIHFVPGTPVPRFKRVRPLVELETELRSLVKAAKPGAR